MSRKSKFIDTKLPERPRMSCSPVQAGEGCVWSSARPKWSDRRPYSVVEESPSIDGRVPHQVGLRRPRRRRWRRRRPRRRGSPGSPGSPACGSALGRRALPVVALIPVPVVVGAPGRVPLITRAPVVAGRRGRGRLRRDVEAAGQSESGQSQPATHQHTRRPLNPRSRLLYLRHPSRVSLTPQSRQVVLTDPYREQRRSRLGQPFDCPSMTGPVETRVARSR